MTKSVKTCNVIVPHKCTVIHIEVYLTHQGILDTTLYDKFCQFPAPIR